jgi:hypothetical protein
MSFILTKIRAAIKASMFVEDRSLSNDKIESILSQDSEFKKILPQVFKDISWVKFGMSNFTFSPSCDEDIAGVQHFVDGNDAIVCRSCGDGEVPVYFIIYCDETSLRGFIPRFGNLYNHDTNVAYGHECPKLSEAVIELFEYDFKKMVDDINVMFKFRTDIIKPCGVFKEEVKKEEPKTDHSDVIGLIVSGIAKNEGCDMQKAFCELLKYARRSAKNAGVDFDAAIDESYKKFREERVK